MANQEEQEPTAASAAAPTESAGATAAPAATPHPAPSPSPSPSSPTRQPELIPADDPELPPTNTFNSQSSTASVTASILEYRTIQGRTYHSDRYPTEYFTPNDEQQLKSVDITHHYLNLLLGDNLYLAPIPNDVQVRSRFAPSWILTDRAPNRESLMSVPAPVSGPCMPLPPSPSRLQLTERSDFADQFPNTEVIGSDLSPCQPQWVFPNVKFEIHDATLAWTWKDNSFDFVHIRYLFGAIQDWNALFNEAYRCCAPGGWAQSCEADVHFYSDDGTTESEPVLKTWARLYEEGGKAMGRPFFLLQDQLQEKGFNEAGFTDIKVVDYKLPVGGWPKNPELAQVGQFVKLTLENDLEAGYTLLLWHNVLNWPKDNYQLFLMGMRKALRNRKIHSYMVVRYVYARKPEA
ncbi:hypothetical protein FALBO_14151 [Fusarium albosuccineum]|uniref:Methyltransferase n=1 Tax=Fusarium albosuccineum TaxID=1237068 RepID=A0A8H4P7K2_9HYPO|nr:hypothetical protein FALBO_14151 [Fusarium albosuccineum]